MKYKKEFELAKKVAFKVGKILRLDTEKKIISQKKKDIKLDLDQRSEEIIISELSKNFGYTILSEESGLINETKKSQPYWIIDPLDGTLNFSRSNPSCCVSIAFWKKKNPLFGVIYDFNRNELFSGYQGKGAWLNNKKLKIRPQSKKSQSILATGFPVNISNNKKDLQIFITQIQEYKKIRMIGSAALSLAYICCGRFDIYKENNIKLWDIAAGVAINKAIGNKFRIKYLENFETNTKVWSSYKKK